VVAHIDLGHGAPGILGLLQYRPETARPLMELAEVLLRGASTLGRGERELIAAHVSRLNDCDFCFNAHGTHAALQLDGGWDTVEAALAGADSPPITAKTRSLLAIAEAVGKSGRSVTTELTQDAKECGATDLEIHDTVLIAAAFSMFNRYVDGLGVWAPANRDDYLAPGRRIVDRGYLA
jgi:uncharacterized peroxidase-related enzyme